MAENHVETPYPGVYLLASQLPPEERVAPAFIWAAGCLYSAYYLGEVLGVFDAADEVTSRWAGGWLDLPGGPAARVLARLHRRSLHRLSAELRCQLYARVFQFEPPLPGVLPAGKPPFDTLWTQLLSAAALYPGQQAGDETIGAGQGCAQIRYATQALQRHLSAALNGGTYLMAAEVVTMLRESLDLLAGPDLARQYDLPCWDLAAVVARVLDGHHIDPCTAARVQVLAGAGTRILQEWVATNTCAWPSQVQLANLLEPARAWNAAWSMLSADGSILT